MAGLSVPEVVIALINQQSSITALAPGGVVDGPADEEDQRAGVIEVAETGFTRTQRYVRAVNARVGISIIAFDINRVDAIKNEFLNIFEDQAKELMPLTKRRVVTQPSTAQQFLVHYVVVTGGPHIQAGDLAGSYEQKLYLDVMIGTEPL